MLFSKISALLLSASMFTSTAFGFAVPLGGSPKFDAQWNQCHELQTLEICNTNNHCEWIDKESRCRITESAALKLIQEDDKSLMHKLAVGGCYMGAFFMFLLLAYGVNAR